MDATQLPLPNGVIQFPATPQTLGARKNEQLLHTVLDNMEQGVLMFDADARLVFCNRRYLSMYGLSEVTAAPGCSLRDSCSIAPRSAILPATSMTMWPS